MTKKIRNRLLALILVLFPLFAWAVSILFAIHAAPPPLPPMPNPNGYPELVKAGELVSTHSGDFDTATLEQLRETTVANAEALALARAGLSNECRVPVQYDEAYDASHVSDLTGLKRLAQALMAEGRLAEMAGHPTAAARAYSDVVRLGNKSARGGVLIDQLVGAAISRMGTSSLERIVDQLDASSCQKTAADLEMLDAQAETWNEIMHTEITWSRRRYPSFRYEIMRLINGKSLKKSFEMAKSKFEENQLKSRRLIINLSVRAFTLNQGHPPASLAELVPAYLKAVPQDPFTHTNIVYTP